MPRLYDLAERSISNFCGLKFSDNDVDEALAILKEGRNVYLGTNATFCGALSLGFQTTVMTTLNVCPEVIHEIYEAAGKNDFIEAKAAQDRLNHRIREVCPRGADWVSSMKAEFNQIKIESVHVGPVRKPKSVV